VLYSITINSTTKGKIVNGEPNAIDLARTTKVLKSTGAIHVDVADAYNYLQYGGESKCYFHSPEDLRKAAFKNPERFSYSLKSSFYEVVPFDSAPCVECTK
jgi:hypothetical protein